MIANPVCRLIGFLHRKCSGHVQPPSEVPPALRDASHRLANDTMVLHQALRNVQNSAGALADLVERNGNGASQ